MKQFIDKTKTHINKIKETKLLNYKGVFNAWNPLPLNPLKDDFYLIWTAGLNPDIGWLNIGDKIYYDGWKWNVKK